MDVSTLSSCSYGKFLILQDFLYIQWKTYLFYKFYRIYEFFLQCRHLHSPHGSPKKKKAFYRFDKENLINGRCLAAHDKYNYMDDHFVQFRDFSYTKYLRDSKYM